MAAAPVTVANYRERLKDRLGEWLTMMIVLMAFITWGIAARWMGDSS